MNEPEKTATSKPKPVMNALSEPYWQAAARGELMLQRCQSCRHWIHFPEARCPQCKSRSLDFEKVSGKGQIESFSIVHRSFVEGFDNAPYVIAWVALPEQAGLRVLTNIINYNANSINQLSIGQTVELCFEQRDDFGQLPQFTLPKNTQWEK